MKLNLWLTLGDLPAARSAERGNERKKKARHDRRAFAFRCEASDLALCRLFLDDGFLFRLGLRTAARTLGERRFDLLDRFGLGDALHGGNLARQPVERGLVELPLGIRLLRLR